MENDDVPKCYSVGLTYNIKKTNEKDHTKIESEYDSIDTIKAIKKAIETLNCKVELLEADGNIFNRIKDSNFDIIFNISEGTYGRGREGQIPAVLSYLNIPYTGSDETTLCMALDKDITKKMISLYKIKTPRYQLVKNETDKINDKLRFPLIIKPNAQGSSIGIIEKSIVENKEELKKVLHENFKISKEPLLLEEFIRGREFTVGIIGNGEDVDVLTPMEIIYENKLSKYNLYSYTVKQDYSKYVRYECPSKIDKKVEDQMKKDALRIYNILGCRDLSRIDFRVSKDNKIFFIEVNPLPGLAPNYSDFPMITGFCGINYDATIKSILNSALKRYNLNTL